MIGASFFVGGGKRKAGSWAMALIAESLEEFVTSNSCVAGIDVFVDMLDLLAEMRCEGLSTATMVGRRTIPPVLLKAYIYGLCETSAGDPGRLDEKPGRNVDVLCLRPGSHLIPRRIAAFPQRQWPGAFAR